MFPDIFSRLVNSGRAALAAWNGQALIPTQQAGWELWSSRLFRYELYDQYYSNNVYSFSDRFSPIHKSAYELYKNIRAIENVVNRLIELYVSKVYGGSINMETLETGAIPFALNDNRTRQAIRRAFTDSNWQTLKSLYVRQGALYGDVGLWIVDDREKQQVRLETLDPRKIKHCTFDSIGNVTEVHIEYYKVEEKDTATPGGMPARNMYLYTLIATEEKFITFKNGTPYAFFKNANGELVSEWDNEYGFVPLVMVQHRNIGLSFGMNPFQASLRKIDELNDMVSLLDDAIRKHVNVLWYFAGVSKSTDLVASTTDRDQMPAVYGPAGSKPEPMVAQIDIAAASAHINELILEIERDMPELALHRLREKGLATAPGVRASYSDAIDRIVEARGNYDAGLERALKMLIRIGGYNRYQDYEGFSLDSEPKFYIKERPVIDDELPKQEKVAALITSQAPREAIWSELGYTQDTIDNWNLLLEEQLVIDAPPNPSKTALQLPNNVPAQLGDGTQSAPNAPAIKGAKLPPDQALKATPISDDELAAIGAMHRKMKAEAVA